MGDVRSIALFRVFLGVWLYYHSTEAPLVILSLFLILGIYSFWTSVFLFGMGFIFSFSPFEQGLLLFSIFLPIEQKLSFDQALSLSPLKTPHTKVVLSAYSLTLILFMATAPLASTKFDITLLGGAFLVLLPCAFWNELIQFAATLNPFLSKKPIHVYYDFKCAFCRKLVYLMKTFLFIHRVIIAPSNVNPRVEKTMKAENSWIIELSAEESESNTKTNYETYFRFEAFCLFIKNSLFFWWAVPILEWTPVDFIGDKIYRWVASHRKQLSWMTKLITPQKYTFKNHFLTQSPALYLWIFLTSWFSFMIFFLYQLFR